MCLEGILNLCGHFSKNEKAPQDLIPRGKSFAFFQNNKNSP